MKKITLLICVSMILCLAGCGHKHVWSSETCSDAKICGGCGESEGEPIGHSAGEWEIIRQAEINSSGEKVKKCTVCGKIIETAEIEALSEPDKKDIIDKSEYTELDRVAYVELVSNPDRYIGEYFSFKGWVNECAVDENSGSWEMIADSINQTIQTENETVFTTNSVYAMFPGDMFENAPAKFDDVVLYGKMLFTTTVTLNGNPTDIPVLWCEYVEIE